MSEATFRRQVGWMFDCDAPARSDALSRVDNTVMRTYYVWVLDHGQLHEVGMAPVHGGRWILIFGGFEVGVTLSPKFEAVWKETCLQELSLKEHAAFAKFLRYLVHHAWPDPAYLPRWILVDHFV